MQYQVHQEKLKGLAAKKSRKVSVENKKRNLRFYATHYNEISIYIIEEVRDSETIVLDAFSKWVSIDIRVWANFIFIMSILVYVALVIIVMLMVWCWILRPITDLATRLEDPEEFKKLKYSRSGIKALDCCGLFKGRKQKDSKEKSAINPRAQRQSVKACNDDLNHNHNKDDKKCDHHPHNT